MFYGMLECDWGITNVIEVNLGTDQNLALCKNLMFIDGNSKGVETAWVLRVKRLVLLTLFQQHDLQYYTNSYIMYPIDRKS